MKDNVTSKTIYSSEKLNNIHTKQYVTKETVNSKFIFVNLATISLRKQAELK